MVTFIQCLASYKAQYSTLQDAAPAPPLITRLHQCRTNRDKDNCTFLCIFRCLKSFTPHHDRPDPPENKSYGNFDFKGCVATRQKNPFRLFEAMASPIGTTNQRAISVTAVTHTISSAPDKTRFLMFSRNSSPGPKKSYPRLTT